MAKQKPQTVLSLPERRPQSTEEWNVVRAQVAVISEELAHARAVMESVSGGALRTCYFIEQIPERPTQALVTTEGGDDAVAIVKDMEMLQGLKRTDKVLVKEALIVESCPIAANRGDIATFERPIGPKKLEVSYEGKRMVCWSSEALGNQIADGTVKPGRQLIIKAGPGIAFEALPEPTGLNRYKFLVQEQPPDVTIERDIGSPPKCIEEITEFIRIELTRPQLHRKYGIRAMIMQLLEGVSGSGKTLAIRAIWRRIYEIISEVIKAPVCDLPFLVFRMKASQMLSQWLGESDKNLDRFFDEVEQMSKTPFTWKGKDYFLPVLVVMEEIDGIAGQRGRDHDGVHDRILTTALQRMDPTVMEDRPVVFTATTNEPGSVDRAFLRRIGGNIEHFGMLTHESFPMVLSKHVNKVPVQDGDGTPQKKLREALVEKLTDLFFRTEQPHVVDLYIHGKETPVPKYRRDFLTPALVDRAVQAAAKHAVKMEMAGRADGISHEMLSAAFNQQVKSIVSQLNETNAHRYVTIPEGDKVSKVRHVTK